MSQFDPQKLVTRAFVLLRQNGFPLGTGEYLAALRAVKGGFCQNQEALAETLRILWCHSRPQQSQFEPIWQSLLSSQPSTREVSSSSEPKPDRRDPQQAKPKIEEAPPPPPQPEESWVEPEPDPEPVPFPVQSPFLPIEGEEADSLQTYYPITRRSMIYSWRYLRRLVVDGPADVLDMDATVEQAARQGVYLAPAYRRRERNDARLVLFLDQNGSMTPLHRFTRDLVETALYESNLDQEKVHVFYFQNVPAESVYQDPFLTDPIELSKALSVCDRETSALIVSDAGAARGYRRLERIQATTDFLFQLKLYTTLFAWLNPMPADRWIGSSAEIIANLVKMYEMDDDGLNNAIDIVRGQPLQSLHSPFL